MSSVNIIMVTIFSRMPMDIGERDLKTFTAFGRGIVQINNISFSRHIIWILYVAFKT